MTKRTDIQTLFMPWYHYTLSSVVSLLILFQCLPSLASGPPRCSEVYKTDNGLIEVVLKKRWNKQFKALENQTFDLLTRRIIEKDPNTITQLNNQISTLLHEMMALAPMNPTSFWNFGILLYLEGNVSGVKKYAKKLFDYADGFSEVTPSTNNRITQYYKEAESWFNHIANHIGINAMILSGRYQEAAEIWLKYRDPPDHYFSEGFGIYHYDSNPRFFAGVSNGQFQRGHFSPEPPIEIQNIAKGNYTQKDIDFFILITQRNLYNPYQGYSEAFRPIEGYTPFGWNAPAAGLELISIPSLPKEISDF